MAKEQRLKKENIKKHVVVFQDKDGTVIKTSFVPHGKKPAMPKIPEIKEELAHHRIEFSGWDYDESPVISNLVIKAQYRKVPKQYLVMYFHENGKVIGTESVPYGQAAEAPFYPKKQSSEEFEYIFAGWNTALSSIEKDTMAKAIFVPRKRSYKITFFGDQNIVLKQETVKYGKLPIPPEKALKKEDETYYYHFAGWDKEIKAVSGEENYHAVFSSQYKEYHIEFYNEKEYLMTKTYHYGDAIELPKLTKKGYTLIWSEHSSTVRQNAQITASWEFSNKKNKIIKEGENLYRITNPSVSSGTISIVSYCDAEHRVITIPEKIKIGDYYYKPVSIEKNAFCKCKKMNRLILPDTLEEIGERGLAECADLQQITIGKGLKTVGKYVFKGNRRLKELVIKSGKIKKISNQAFDKMTGKITVKTPALLSYKAEILFAKGISGGNVVLK